METAKRCVGGQIRQLRLGFASPSYGCRTLPAGLELDWGRDGAEGRRLGTGPADRSSVHAGMAGASRAWA